MKPKKTKKKKPSTKYIFVVGGVMSGVGKGVTTASIGLILQSRGFKVSCMKLEQYLNVDAGTMNPVEHGEVFVTEDGLEADQDLGNYERFLNKDVYRENFVTSGEVYLSLLQKERNLEFDGKCVEMVPHVPREIRNRIKAAARKNKAEVMVVEVGGTLGEYQILMYLEAARFMKMEHPDDVTFVMVSYLPIPAKIGEMKTKPTQYAIRTLNSAGIQPVFIVARSRAPIDKPRRKKIAISANIPRENVISAPDIESIYDVPINFEKDKIGDRLLEELKLKSKPQNITEWKKMVSRVKRAKKEINVGIVGKYFATGDFCLSDSYISVIEAIKHAAAANNCKPVLSWINTEEIEKQGIKTLAQYDGVIVPQGWGSRGSEGKIKTIKYCREKGLPYFGLCYGMQMAVIEFARNVIKLRRANSEECDPKTPHPVIHIMPEQKELILRKQYGGTIRLGGWPCKIVPGTHMAASYARVHNKRVVSERHRHRYEFNNKYRAKFEKNGMIIAGTSPDGKIVEAVEITDHPFFIGTQFHPEYISRPLDPHPLFVEFVGVCLGRNKINKKIKK